MGGAAAQRFAGVEVVPVFVALALFPLDHVATDDGRSGEGLPQGLARAFVLADAFGNDVARALQGVVDGRYFVGEVGLGRLLGDGVGPREQQVGQRRQPFLAGHLGARASLRLVGQVEVLQCGGVPAVGDALAQFVGQAALFGNGRAYVFAAADQFLQPFVLFLYGAHLHFVQAAGSLLAVAADEGDGGPVVEQADRLFDRMAGQVELLGN